MGPDDDLTDMSPPGDDEAAVPERVGGRRFRLIEAVARGGSGEVFRAWDEVLRCPAAVKLIRRTDGDRSGPADGDLDRVPAEVLFRDPVLVQVRDRGEWAGGVWVAMEWVEGLDLRKVLGLKTDDWTTGPDENDERPEADTAQCPARLPEQFSGLQLVRALHDVSVGIGAAHRQGLVHLDLKPDNIMLQAPERTAVADRPGPAGVWAADADDAPRWKPRLIDWGLSQRFGLDEDSSITDLMRVGQPGDVPLGVPAYMAPERALGGLIGVQPTADVYALGAILYHILTGERPYGDASRGQALRLLQRGRPLADPRLRADADLVEFCDVCLSATSPDPTQRPMDGDAFARALRRAQGRRLLRKARPLIERARKARAEALAFEMEAAVLERNDGDSHDHRERVWALQDRAAERRTEADLREAQWFQRAREVVMIAPDLAEGWAALVEWHCDRLVAADAEGDGRTALLSLESLRVDMRSLEVGVPFATSEWPAAVLRRAQRLDLGTATLTLAAAPGTRIEVARQILRERQLVVGEFHEVGVGALGDFAVECGPIVLRYVADDHCPVVQPAHLGRGQQWGIDGPGERPVPAVKLPLVGELVPTREVFITSGWCSLGGERFACDAPPRRRVWIDGFVMQRDPVTHGEYLEYLDDLVRRGQWAEALLRVPGKRDRSGRHPPTMPGYHFDGDHFVITYDGGMAGRRLATLADVHKWPVAGISWFDAMHYAMWRAARDGVPWRLPSEWEFEKVARCGDDRRLPWGNHLEPEWLYPGGMSDLLLPVPIDMQTVDETVHGVRWMVSNGLTWCLDGWGPDGPPPDGHLDLPSIIASATRRSNLRMTRGCAWFTPRNLVSGASRFAAPPNSRAHIGLRLVRSWPTTETVPPVPPEMEEDDADPGQ